MQNDELKLLRLYRGADEWAKMEAIRLLQTHQKAQTDKEPPPIGRVTTIEDAMRQRGGRNNG